MEKKLRKLPNALPHCIYHLSIKNSKVIVELTTNKGLYQTDTSNIGYFDNVLLMDIFDYSGRFIASIRDGNASGIAKINRHGRKIDAWLEEGCYLDN